MKVEITTDINAAPETAWQVLSDIERWPEWTASVERAKLLDTQHLALSSRARLLQPGLPAAVWRVTSIEPGRSFTWGTRMHGAHVAASHRVEPAEDGCRVTLRLDMTGPTVPLFWPLIRRRVGSNVQMEADGLRRECERRQPAAPLDWARTAA